MKQIIKQLCSLLVVMFIGMSSTCYAIPTINSKKVLISQSTEHPALDATTRGIIDGLMQNNYQRGVNLDLRVESAQSNSALAAQIANKFVQQQPDVVVAVGTLSAQSFIKYATKDKIRLVFVSVTDPVSASIVKSIQQPGNNTTGVSNFIALEPQLKLFKELQPNLQRLGVMYNPGEINSVVIIDKLAVACKKYKITLIPQAVARTVDIPQSAIKLAANCDAIFISNDNTMLSAIQSIIKAANNKKIPVYVSDTDVVSQGALAALGPNQYEIGVQAADMIAKLLAGSAIADMPVQFPQQTQLYINLTAADKSDIKVSKTLIASASKVISVNKL